MIMIHIPFAVVRRVREGLRREELQPYQFHPKSPFCLVLILQTVVLGSLVGQLLMGSVKFVEKLLDLFLKAGAF